MPDTTTTPEVQTTSETKPEMTTQATPAPAAPKTVTPPPKKKEAFSFLSVFTIGLSLLFFALWVVEMKKPDTIAPKMMEAESAQEETVAQYVMPEMAEAVGTVELPEPSLTGDVSVEEAIQNRRSKRVYTEEPVSMADLSQMLWSAQGVTDESGHRTAPSARGVYPHTLFVVVRNVEGLDAGLYRYEPETHSLSDLGMANAGDMLSEAGVQDNSKNAPVVVAIATAYAKAQEMFPNNPQSVSDLEAGHIGQNLYLQAESLGLGTVVTAGFNSSLVAEKLGLDQNFVITYLVPFGNPGEEVEAAH